MTIFNNDTFYFLEIFNVCDKNIGKIRNLADPGEYDEKRLDCLLSELFFNMLLIYLLKDRYLLINK